MDWRKTPWGWTSRDASGVCWSIHRVGLKVVRGRIVRRYWLYRDGVRYSATGHFADARSFVSAKSAQKAANLEEEK